MEIQTGLLMGAVTGMVLMAGSTVAMALLTRKVIALFKEVGQLTTDALKMVRDVLTDHENRITELEKKV